MYNGVFQLEQGVCVTLYRDRVILTYFNQLHDSFLSTNQDTSSENPCEFQVNASLVEVVPLSTVEVESQVSCCLQVILLWHIPLKFINKRTCIYLSKE